MAICFNFKLSIFFFMFFFFCTCALAQQDPPRRDCCYHIFAAGSNLGCASALLDHTIERTRLEAADLPIIDNIKRAGPHIREANRACSYINPAWNDWRGRTNWLQERADMLRKKPVPGTRRQVARSIASTYQWGDALRVQLADGRRFTMDTCGEKYFELGFLFGYAQQALKIADEWLHAGRNYWRSPIRAARSKLHRSLQVLDQYDLVRPITGSCVNIVNLRLRETVSYILKANAQYELKTMINAMDNIWWDLEERVQNDCPGVQVPDDRDWDWDSDPIPPPDPNQRNRCSKLEQAFYRAIDRGFTDKAHSILIQGEDCPFYQNVMNDDTGQSTTDDGWSGTWDLLSHWDGSNRSFPSVLEVHFAGQYVSVTWGGVWMQNVNLSGNTLRFRHPGPPHKVDVVLYRNGAKSAPFISSMITSVMNKWIAPA